jgi:hypothetical protein
VWAVLAALACLGILVGIALWVVSLIARGGLVAGVQQVEEASATTFGTAWRAGAGRFWTLFGISILTGLPALIATIVGMIVLAMLILGTIAAFDAAAEVGGYLGGSAAVLCGGVLCCGGILLAIVLAQIRLYAERAAMLEGLDWISAFKRGWQVLKENLGATVVFWLIFVVIGMIVGAVIAAPLFVLMVPLAGMMGHQAGNADWLVVPMCCGGLLWLIFAALVGSVVQTFTSATWTLAYRQFTGTAVLTPIEAAGEATALE